MWLPYTEHVGPLWLRFGSLTKDQESVKRLLPGKYQYTDLVNVLPGHAHGYVVSAFGERTRGGDSHGSGIASGRS